MVLHTPALTAGLPEWLAMGYGAGHVVCSPSDPEPIREGPRKEGSQDWMSQHPEEVEPCAYSTSAGIVTWPGDSRASV